MALSLRRKAMVASVTGALAALFVAGALTRPVLLESVATASTQSCDTDCQTKMTDCILACDGVLACEQGCKSRAIGCVESCRAGPSPPSSGEGTGTDAGEDASLLDGGRGRDAARNASDAARNLRDARAPSRD